MLFGADDRTCASRSVVDNRSPGFSEGGPLVDAQKSEFWFKDGNVILMAGSVAFKVHRGNLERHSEVFRDLMSLPQPQDVTLFEDCHIVDLYDSPSDLWFLLKAIYDGLYFKHLNASDFQVITAVYRLSAKYLIDHLRDRCLSRLSIDWPSSLVNWDSREIEATDPLGRYNPRIRFPHPIKVINFAREMGVSSVLPCAFYDLCRYGPSKIVAGTPMSQTKTPCKLAASPDIDTSEEITHLCLADLQIALVGRERAQRVVANFIEEELSNRDVAEDCHNKDRDGGRVCRESFYFIMLNLLRSVGGLSCGRDCDPLFTLNQAAEMMSRSDFSDGTQFCSLKICAACKMDFSQAVKASRERIWMQIPSWFGMEDYTGDASSE